MKFKINKKRLAVCTSIFAVASIIFIILAYSKYYFHSDCMGFLFQAQEQFKQGKLYPDRFHYTTGIFGFTTSIFMLPFVGVVKNEYLLHEIGSIIAIILVTLCIFILFHEKKEIAGMIIFLLFIPLSWTYVDMMFFQAAFINTWILILIRLLILKKIFQIQELKSFKSLSLIVLYLLIVVFTNYYGVSNYIYVEFPLLISLIGILWIKYGLNTKKYIQEDTEKTITIFLTIIGIVISFVLFKLLCQKVGFNSSTTTGGMMSPTELCSRFNYVFCSFLSLFGIYSTGSLFAVTSIYICACYVFMLITVVLFPIYCIKNIKLLESDFTKFLVLFSVSESVILLFLIFFCGMSEGRYYLPAMLGNAIVAVFAIEILKAKHYKHFKNILYVLIVFFSFLSHLISYKDYNYAGLNKSLSFEQLFNPTFQSDIIDYLKKESVNYGYATFWNSYQLMIMSNSTVEIAAYDEGDPLTPYYFNSNSNKKEYYACSEDLYNPKLHEGKCFVLVREGETIDSMYYELASKQTEINGFTILIFDQNINNYEELK